MIYFIQRMKKIEVSTIIDFLRRISETTNDKLQVRDEKYHKCIYFMFSEDNYIGIYISDDHLSITGAYFGKEMEITEAERCELLFYFNKILSKKEDEVFYLIDKACRYKDSIDF